jgi:hypothetical protein
MYGSKFISFVKNILDLGQCDLDSLALDNCWFVHFLSIYVHKRFVDCIVNFLLGFYKECFVGSILIRDSYLDLVIVVTFIIGCTNTCVISFFSKLQNDVLSSLLLFHSFTITTIVFNFNVSDNLSGLGFISHSSLMSEGIPMPFFTFSFVLVSSNGRRDSKTKDACRPSSCCIILFDDWCSIS